MNDNADLEGRLKGLLRDMTDLEDKMKKMLVITISYGERLDKLEKEKKDAPKIITSFM